MDRTASSFVVDSLSSKAYVKTRSHTILQFGQVWDTVLGLASVFSHVNTLYFGGDFGRQERQRLWLLECDSIMVSILLDFFLLSSLYRSNMARTW